MAPHDSPSSLPDPWVERIFAKLALVYGRDFLSRWEGQDLKVVKADWGHELRCFQQSPKAIAYGLSALDPAKPPTVLQFREACLRAPQYAPPALPAPKADPAVVAAALGAFQRPKGFSFKGWAYALQEREQRGDRLTEAQRAAWRLALQHRMDEGLGGAFTPILADALPPAMRADAHTILEAA